MLNPNFLYRGSDEPLPERIRLRAGPLEMLFDNGDLRSLRLGGREILRRVYVAVRDGTWGTIPARISNLRVQIDEDSFAIDYDVENQQGGIDFAWHAALRGTASGRVTFAMDGAARSTFLKNRIGFCVLFPAGLSGQPALVEHIDGTREETAFPGDIRADQPVRPFDNLRGVTLPLGAGGEAAVRFSGDVFEMEDQRLWTDASFKVFCTPLALPYPAEIRAGTRVRQQIELELRDGELPSIASRDTRSAAAAQVHLPAEAEWKPIPLLGLGAASHGQALSAGEIERLKALHPRHLRVDLPLADPAYPARLERAASEAAALGIGLEAALLVGAEHAGAELDGLRGRLDALRPPVVRWLVYPAKELYAGGSPSEQVLRAARTRLEGYGPGTPFASGTNTDFIFLKRSPPPTSWMDQVCIALNPQVHAFDDLSLLETLEGQAMVVASARLLAGGLPVVVSPVTLKPRFNPHVAGPQPETPPGTLPPQVDPRQRSLFGAGWTLGCLRAMVTSGAASLTLFETTGWRGVMECEAGSPWPPPFPSLAGIVYPLYHDLADVGEFAGGQAAGWGAADGSPLSGLALRLGSRAALLIANPTGEEQALDLAGLDRSFTLRTLRVLDAGNAEQALHDPEGWRQSAGVALEPPPTIAVPPYGYVRLDFEQRSSDL